MVVQSLVTGFEMFGKLCHGLTQENGADVCGRVF